MTAGIRRNVWLAGLCALAMAGSALALPVKEVGDFDAFWGFDLTEPDLDANFDLFNNVTGAPGADGEGDFFGNMNTSTPGVSIEDGALVMDMTGTRRNLIWENTPLVSATSGFTIEYRIKIDEITGSVPILVIYGTKPGAPIAGISYSLSGLPGEEMVNVHWALSANPDLIKATLPKEEFFTVRVAETFDEESETPFTYSLFVNDALVEDNLLPTHPATTSNLMLLGRASGTHAGIIRYDYLAFTAGAFAPDAEVPLLPGDANRDGRVDGEDFLIWQASFSTQEGATWDDGDFNGDGRVDGEDFLIWQANFGTVAGSSAVTPEPAALSLLGLAGLLLRRRGCTA